MITFTAQGIDFPDIDTERMRTWIKCVAASYGKSVGDINYIFVDDERILQVNREFINHDYYTDHIGFDYSEGKYIIGDTFISLDTIKTNAVLFNKDFVDELHRVIIHSILHLCGIDDKEPGEREIMEREEDKALALLQD